MSRPSTSPHALSERLQDVTEALAAARTQEGVFEVVLQPALDALGAIAGAVLLVDMSGDRLEVAATQGHEEDTQTVWQDGPLNGNVPAGDALERHEPLFFEHEGDLVRAYPELEARTGGVAAVATAVLPMFLDDSPLGTLILDFEEPHDFTPEEGRFLRILAAQCAIALGRARLTTDLQRQVQERTRRIEKDARAHEAFVAFTQTIGTETDVITLAGRAVNVLQARFTQGIGGYYEREGDLWKLRTWTSNLGAQPDFIATLQAGLPSDTPFIAELLRERAPIFTESWDAQHEGIEDSDDYGTVAACPVIVAGEVLGFFTMGFKTTSRWAERDRAIFRAVGHSLTLALERAEQTRRLAEQNVELDARTQTLEAFADLSRDLTLHSEPGALIRRAQEIVRSLLPPGFAVYYELEQGLWRVRSQVDSHGSPELQTAVDAGLPRETPSLLTPFETGRPLYQDVYPQGADMPAEMVQHVQAVATLPLVVDGVALGVFGVGLFEGRVWSAADRAVLETVVHSLGLALERAQGVRQLEEERAALAAFTAFTEAVGDTTDVLTLAAQALEALRGRFPDGSGGYYVLEDHRWKLRLWTEDMNAQPELLEALQAGLPEDTPVFAEIVGTAAPVFVERWDAGREGVERSETYASSSGYPLLQEGQVRAVLALGRLQEAHWSERDRAIVRAVGRSLGLALERAQGVADLAQRSQDLDRERTFLRAVLESLSEGVVACDPEGRLTLFNDATRVFHGQSASPLPPEAWTGQYDLFEGDGVTPLVTERIPLYRAWRGERVRDAEMVIHPKNGEARSIVASGQAIFTEAGVPLGAVVAMHDITERKRAEEELRRSNAELEQFAYIASHDLQAPIRAVTSFAGVIERKYGGLLDDRGHLYLRQIMESGEHMKRLVDDLLTFSRVHTEQRDLSPVDSGAVFDTVARRLGAETGNAGARITREQLPQVLADAQQLDQLFQNLISNGLKYHREGVPPQVQVSAERDGDGWRFAVRDNGIGIEAQYYERIFVIFQRLHGRQTYEGTGIGLAVCKKIVERHGGRLWLESRVGEGTTFFFTLPGA